MLDKHVAYKLRGNRANRALVIRVQYLNPLRCALRLQVFVDCINVKAILGFSATVFGGQGKYETANTMLACVNVNEELL